MSPSRWLAYAAPALCVIVAGPALAHHSFAMFDRSQTNTLAGVVKAFDMINPHGWVQLVVVDPKGGTSEWSLETGGPGQLARAGWKAETLKPGDKITATIHPLRDGSHGGQLVSVQLADGSSLRAGGPPRAD